MRDKGRLEPLLFAVAGLGFAACWLLQQPRRQLPRHQIERRKTRALILVIPGPHQRTTPLHAQGGVERRNQRKTCFILAQQPALALLGFFLTRSGLPGRPAASPGCRADSGTSGDRAGYHGADRTPAWSFV